jgi:dUTP pyrophosphatase
MATARPPFDAKYAHPALYTLPVKLLNNDVKLAPQTKTVGAAGMDLVLAHDIMIREGEVAMVSTGVSVEIPVGCFGLLAMRSSIHDVTLTNGIGVIDSDYRGVIMLKLRGIDDVSVYHAGDRIAQLIVIPYLAMAPLVCEALPQTARGDGGFGSTGKGA